MKINYLKPLTEDFIREFQDKIDWNLISECQKLNENFIREFQDKVNWYYISWHQKLNEPFILEFQDKISWRNLLFKNGYYVNESNNKYQIISISNNYNSNYLLLDEFKKLALRLISLKAFQ